MKAVLYQSGRKRPVHFVSPIIQSYNQDTAKGFFGKVFAVNTPHRPACCKDFRKIIGIKRIVEHLVDFAVLADIQAGFVLM